MKTHPTNLNKETWTQDALDADLWLGAHGLIVNTAALEARTAYYEVTRVYQAPRHAHAPQAAAWGGLPS